MPWNNKRWDRDLTVDGKWFTQLFYNLRASFTAADQALTNNQVLDTDAEGVQEGSLTVVDTSTGVVSIDTNRLDLVGDGSVWTTTGLLGAAETRVFGKTLFWTINEAAATNKTLTGWKNTADMQTADHGVYFKSDGTLHYYNQTSSISAALEDYSADTDYPLACILGGFDSNGLPWYPGQNPANYLYGCSLYVELSSVWELKWCDVTLNTSTMYPQISQNTGTSYTTNLKVPKDLLIQVPPALFESATGTGSIDGVNPDYSSTGAVWETISGTVEKSGGKLVPTNTSTRDNIAVTDIGDADVIISATLTYDDNASRFDMLVSRATDSSNYMYIMLNDDDVSINKKVTGSASTLDTTAFVMVDDQDYEVVFVLNGTDAKLYIDGVLKCETDAAVFTTATKHGVRFYTNSDFSVRNLACNNIIIRPITSTQTTNEFKKVGY